MEKLGVLTTWLVLLALNSFTLAGKGSTKKEGDHSSSRAGAGSQIPPDRQRQLRVFGRPLVGFLNNAKPDRYPYFARLYNDDDSDLCGGTLVAPSVVLTSGDCFGRFSLVDIGREALVGEGMFETFGIDSEVRHPDYDASGLVPTANLMLVKLDGISSMSVAKLNVDPSVPEIGQEFMALGYGAKTPVPVPRPTRLQQIPLTYVSNTDCGTKSDPGQGISLNEQILEEHLCAGGPGPGICNGDDGGPLLIAGMSPDEDLQVGVVSAFFGCSQSQVPDVFERVAAYVGWIHTTTCEISIDDLPTEQRDEFGCMSGSAVPEKEAPVTPSPVTPEPATPSPATPAPATPNPTMSPVTPAPTPSPATPAPVSPEPTPAPLTLAPTPTPAPATPAPGDAPLFITVKIIFDNFPQETGWMVINDDTGEVIANVPSLSYSPLQTSIEVEVPVELGGTYTFVIRDLHDDGLCCRDPGGSYSVEYDGIVVANGGGNFGSEESQTFTIPSQ